MRLLGLMLLAALPPAAGAFDLQGHRGARGLYPENTLAACAGALAIGVTTIEADLAVTHDDVVVVTHDLTLNPDIVRGPDGRWLEPPGAAVRALRLDDLARLDVGRARPGSEHARRFASQIEVDGQAIPTLAELIALCDSHAPRPRYNLETKLSPLAPHLSPEPRAFVALVVAALRAAGAIERTTLQSFDWRTLIAARELEPALATSCLTIDLAEASNVRAVDGRPSPWLAGLDPETVAGSLPRLVREAGCAVWSPYWQNLTPDTLAQAHELGLAVLPWTVNAPEDIAAMVDLGVDGLITDYPDIARAVLAARAIPLPPARSIGR